ncbi:hypothetical protein EV401DRAFT_364642 [Pisolithus croceorrhizus]|nr:hypothetical protein EV401DRAFT_364642 [Pisolithus croceorrhizus]
MDAEAEVRQRLIDAEGSLLSALSDESLLPPFHSMWSKLEVDISDMKGQGILTEDTLGLAHAVASRISTVLQCYLEVRHERNVTGFVSSGKEGSVGLCQASMSRASLAQSADERYFPFIATTSKWLLEHIHNPYPSPQFKASVAEACGCSQNSVNSWFIGARRSIGWTSLCREQFRSCRADAADAAYRALVRPDPARPLPAAVIEAFLVVKMNAEGLYSSFIKNVTAVDLDAIVNDTADHNTQRLFTEGNYQQNICRGVAEIPTYHEDQRSETAICFSPFSFPPPSISAVPTLVPSLSDESDDEDQDVAPPVLAGRKRRTSLSENQRTAPMERPKRLCIRPSPNSSPDATEPPSPSSDKRSATHASLELRTKYVPPRSRKRRLSEGAPRNIPKSLHGLPVTPRLQVVSDPLPRTTISHAGNMEDWFQMNFQTLFDLPAPVECSDLDPSTQWEVLFGGYAVPSVPLQSEPHLVPSPLRSSESVLQDVQERGGGFSDFDDLLLPLRNEACANTLPGIRSSALHFSPEHQFALSDGMPSLESVSFLDQWVTFCESTQTESLDTHASSELGLFELPDLLALQPLVDGQAAHVVGDIGLPVGA